MAGNAYTVLPSLALVLGLTMLIIGLNILIRALSRIFDQQQRQFTILKKNIDYLIDIIQAGENKR